MAFLPFEIAPPKDKYEVVGNSRTGTLKIRSIAALSKPEMDWYKSKRENLYMLLAKAAREAHAKTGKRYKFEDVFDTLRAPILGKPPAIVELEAEMLEFQQVYDRVQEKNDALLAIAVLRQRVAGCESLDLDTFFDDEKVPPGLRSKLTEFAAQENAGWPEDKDKEPSAPEPAPSEEEAGK